MKRNVVVIPIRQGGEGERPRNRGGRSVSHPPPPERKKHVILGSTVRLAVSEFVCNWPEKHTRFLHDTYQSTALKKKKGVDVLVSFTVCFRRACSVDFPPSHVIRRRVFELCAARDSDGQRAERYEFASDCLGRRLSFSWNPAWSAKIAK